jgi:hypothetical protein
MATNHNDSDTDSLIDFLMETNEPPTVAELLQKPAATLVYDFYFDDADEYDFADIKVLASQPAPSVTPRKTGKYVSIPLSTVAEKKIEWESTITIPIDEHIFTRQLNYCVDYIFVYANGARMSQRRIEKKTTTYTRRLLNFYRNNWLAIERTTAIEELLHVSLIENVNIVQCIERHIVLQSPIRIAYNRIATNKGVCYTITYEIEYPNNTHYLDILHRERVLMVYVLKDGYCSHRAAMSLEDMFANVMVKVQMWHNFNCNEDFIWAYKWNGIKAKLLITEQLVTGPPQETDGDYTRLGYVWPDTQAVVVEHCRGANISWLVNLCLLVEMMDDCLVLIEVIGVMVDGRVYTTEPMANASTLKKLDTLLGKIFIGDRPLYIQRYFNKPLAKHYDYKRNDGFIIVQNDMVIKWKIPTIDVKCVRPYYYSVAGGSIELHIPTECGVVGAIYEISHHNEILRRRTDRMAASNAHEYAVFLESVQRLNDRIQVLNDDTSTSISTNELSCNVEPSCSTNQPPSLTELMAAVTAEDYEDFFDDINDIE